MTHAARVDHGGGPSLSVVIPVYNEEAILAPTVEAVVSGLRADEALGRFEVVISENGSRDGTRPLARELAGRYDEVVVLTSDVADYGAAMRAGFLAASGTFIVNFDADYYDLEFVQNALDRDADIVIAAKGIPGSVDTRTRLRRVVTRAFGFLVRRLLELRTTETHGMKLFRRSAVHPLIHQVRATKDLFDTELVALAERAGLQIVELPITTTEMRHSRSALYRRIPRTLWGLVAMRARLRRPATDLNSTPAWEPCAPPSFLHPLRSDDGPFPGGLLVVGGRRVAVDGAEDGLLCLDASGAAVLVVVLRHATTGTGAQIADELDRVAGQDLAFPGGAAAEGARLPDAHAAFFELSDTERPTLNRDQRAVVLAREPPDTKAWEELVIELGGQLAGVYRLEGDDAVALAVPDELRKDGAPRRQVPVLAAAAAVALTAVVAVLAVRAGGPGPTPPDDSVAAAAVRDVAAGVPAAATHNQWIGQEHLARASDGTLLAFYGSDQGVHIVADQANQGRVWRRPATVPDVPAVSSSIVIDDTDRLHVAFGDGSRAAYAIVEERSGGWATGAVVEVDGDTPTPYLDIAYDETADVAHVVWVEEGPQGQAPRWAAISAGRGTPRVLASDRLAPPGTAIPALVNVAAGPGSRVVATYRRGDSPTGWFSRILTEGGDGALAWGPQERVPTDAGIGASAVAVDPSGTAHLVLRDSTTFALTYYTQESGRAWSDGETAVDGDSVEEIDFPSLALDRSSALVYLFFQSDRAEPRTAVRLAVRDPVDGWQAPVAVAPPEEVPDGAFFPASLAETAGAPTVLWTTAGNPPVLQAAVVVPGG